MTVWGELLFVENAVAGLLLLSLTGKILGREPWRSGGCRAALRLAAGSLLCGAYAFLLFVQGRPQWVQQLSALYFAAIVLVMVFPGPARGEGALRRRLCRLLKELLVYYLVNLLMGGVTVALLFFTGMQGLRSAGGFYIMGWAGYLYVLAGMLLTWLLVGGLAKSLRQRLLAGRTAALVQVEIGERRAFWKGLVDTGNFLRDPLTGAPVFLVEEERLHSLLPQGIPAFRLRWIPYKAVGVDSGFLLGFRPDRVIVSQAGEQGGRHLSQVVIAAYKGKFPRGWDQEECQVLLHPAALT